MASVKKVGKKFRIVGDDNKTPMMNPLGKAYDNGGHDTEDAAKRQLRSVKAAQTKAAKKQQQPSA